MIKGSWILGNGLPQTGFQSKNRRVMATICKQQIYLIPTVGIIPDSWYEGGKVELMGFAPVDNFLLFGVPDMNAEHLIYTNPAERQPANGYGVMAARMLE